MKRGLAGIARLAAFAAALALPTGACAAGETTADGAHARALKSDGPAEVWRYPRVRVGADVLGGLSGLAWDGETDALIAISDRGQVFALPMTVASEPSYVGRIVGGRGVNDPEAIRRTPDGGWRVSFEFGGAIAYYRGDADALTRRPETTLKLRQLADLAFNGGAEALALLDFGRMLAIAEEGEGGDRPAFLIDGAHVVRRAYPSGDFAPVDAVALPNGDVLVLERRFNGFLPPFFSTRLARIPAASLATGAGPLVVAARFDLAHVLPSENWEGLEIVKRDGAASLWLVSDDNFQWPQNTLLARLPLDLVMQKTATDR